MNYHSILLVGKCRDIVVILFVVATVGTVEACALIVEDVTEITAVCVSSKNSA